MLNSKDLTTLAENLHVSVPNGYQLTGLSVKGTENGFEALFILEDNEGSIRYNKAFFTS